MIAAEFLEIRIVSPFFRYDRYSQDSRRQSRYTNSICPTRRQDVERAFLIQCRIRINWN